MAQELALDDVEAAREAASMLSTRWIAAPLHGLSPEAQAAWTRLDIDLRQAVNSLEPDSDVTLLRTRFEALSLALERAVAVFGPFEAETLHKIHCPMAFDGRGAIWFQREAEVSNPYFGASMLRCGSVAEVLPGSAPEEPDHGD